MNTLNELLTLIVGENLTLATFIFCMLLAGMGAFVKMVLIDARPAKIKDLKYSPRKFDWAYWYNDNTKRIAANVFMIYVVIRFLPEFTMYFGFNLPEWFQIPSSFLIGMGIDKIVNRFKKNGLLKNKPENNPARINPNSGDN